MKEYKLSLPEIGTDNTHIYTLLYDREFLDRLLSAIQARLCLPKSGQKVVGHDSEGKEIWSARVIGPPFGRSLEIFIQGDGESYFLEFRDMNCTTFNHMHAVEKAANGMRSAMAFEPEGVA